MAAMENGHIFSLNDLISISKKHPHKDLFSSKIFKLIDTSELNMWSKKD